MTDRARQHARAGRGYSRLVRWMKVALPLAALILIAAIFLIGRGGEDSLFAPEELARLGAGMQLENPKFAGLTEGGDPFTLNAVRANPDGPNPKVIVLDEPVGEIAQQDGRTIHGRADTGELKRHNDELTLTGRVVITTSDGYRADTRRLIIDLDQKSAHAPGPINGFGPEGSISAGSFRAERPLNHQGKRAKDLVIWFEKDVRVVLIPGQSR